MSINNNNTNTAAVATTAIAITTANPSPNANIDNNNAHHNESTTPANDNQSNNNSIGVNGAANRRVPKQKWVPLEIELPKARGKPRERNNNVNTKRREEVTELVAERDPKARRFRATSYRSTTGSITRPINASNSTRTTGSAAGSTSRTNGISSNPRRAPPRATTGGIQKPRHHRGNNQHKEFTLDFPVDYNLVKKLVASGAVGIDAAQPFLMPFMGTFYYNGVPSYANMDSSSLKEAIRKQM